MPRKQLSLDANLVFDLAEERDFAHEFREVFLGRGYRLFLPPTALIELDFLSAEGGTSAERALAREGLLNLRRWGIHPFDLDSTAEGVARRFAGRIRELRLVPEEEVNDGLILAETSLADIPLLITSDRHLLDADEETLLLAFHDADLPPVHPVHPRRLLRALR
ncbi:MAG TPA: hypothetical protein PKM43_14540 [Verrucomicrobiota bacterium]|nr:hypothetical protein [Verrucomicrobiota bacterium]HRZ55886.1 hypothetical protein [Candidatus Paceibacterota bacterium]